MLQLGYIILIAGAAIFIGSAEYFVAISLHKAATIDQTVIKPSKSINATLQVNGIVQPLTLAIHLKPTAMKVSNVTLDETVRSPAGKVVSRNTFANEFITTFNPETTGKYTVTIELL